MKEYELERIAKAVDEFAKADKEGCPADSLFFGGEGYRISISAFKILEPFMYATKKTTYKINEIEFKTYAHLFSSGFISDKENTWIMCNAKEKTAMYLDLIEMVSHLANMKYAVKSDVIYGKEGFPC